MRRREFISLLWGAAAAWPGAGWAQQARTPVIGFLNGASYDLSAFLMQAFHRGLGETGFVEGRNVAVEYRSADGQYNRLPDLAADLVRHNVNVIAATGTPTGLPAKAATTTIPIVFVTGSDPVEQGLVASLDKPGGNLTGATTLAVELGQKRMELLHEMVPTASLIAVLVNQKGPNLASVSRDLEGAARTLNLPIHVLQASNDSELDTAFASLAAQGAGALVIGTDTFFNSKSARLAELALRHKVPAIYQYREFVAAGGLMSYAGSITDAYRVAGVYTARILKGEKPSSLPVQQSTKAELFINLNTAKALGLDVPATLLARADEVIE
jgi:putative tryptophan/tyrosine transport system substrate-binding protein